MWLRFQRWTSALLATLLLAACAPASTSPTTTSPSAPTSPSPTVTQTSTEPAEPTQEPPIPRQITYDPYLLPEHVEGLFDDQLRAEYRRLIDAIMAGKESIPVDPAIEQRDDAWLPGAVISQLNPVGGPVMIGMSPNRKKVLFDYYFDKDEHRQMMDSIAPTVEGLVADLIPVQANDVDAVLAVYDHLARTTSYTQDGPLTGPYGVLIDRSGMCVGFATGMSWLLAQAGVKVSQPIEWTPTDPSVDGHAWSLTRIDGAYFHLDPTFENGETQGQRLTWFGLTDEQRIPSVGTPFTYVLDTGAPVPQATDTRFAPLQDAAYFALDPVAHTVELYDENGTKTVFSTETLTLVG
ncbi:MAG: hypothetical protein QM713_14245 [Arachnia sp.]